MSDISFDLYKNFSYKPYLSAYFHNFDLFEKYFSGKFAETDSLPLFICRGMLHDLDFSLKMFNKYSDIFDEDMKKIYNARLLMSNIIPNNLDFPPFSIWYPNIPSIETLNKLLEYKSMHMSVAVCSVLLNNKELFNKIDLSHNRAYLFYLCKLINSDFVTLTDSFEFSLENEPIVVYSQACYFFRFCQNLDYFIDEEQNLSNVCDPYFKLLSEIEPSYMDDLNFELVDEFRIDRLICNKFKLTDKLSSEFLFILGFEFKTKPFNVWFKVACEYLYVENYEKYKDLKYNIGMALIKAHYNDSYFSFEFLPDIELVKMASISGNKEVYDDQINKYNKLGYWYQHLDLVNNVNLNPPKIIKNFNIDFKFDYLRMLYNSYGDISKSLNIEELINNLK